VELDEIRALSDRVLVMCGGRITGERDPATDEREIGLLMAGIEKRLDLRFSKPGMNSRELIRC
jgi:simple sugar transport system ATP-binding protein